MLGDITVVSQGGQNLPPSVQFRTVAAGTKIYAGEPVIVNGNYAEPAASGDPVTATGTFLGIATSTSTETATADGVVDVCVPAPGVLFKCKVLDVTDIDTDAKLLGILNDQDLFDLTATVYTVEVGAPGAANGLLIVGGDYVNGYVYFSVKLAATPWG